jgi:hypothetical protein
MKRRNTTRAQQQHNQRSNTPDAVHAYYVCMMTDKGTRTASVAQAPKPTPLQNQRQETLARQIAFPPLFDAQAIINAATSR